MFPTDPATDATARFALPFLFPGQMQKEYAINHALAVCDVLLHPVVEGVAAAPPSQPADGPADGPADEALDGKTWIVGTDATGAWAEQSGKLAARQAGVWVFADPVEGMQVYDREAEHTIVYKAGWQRPTAPDAPTGGTTVDTQARAAIVQIIETFKLIGLVPQN